MAFYDWFKKTQKKIVPVEVEDIPEELIETAINSRMLLKASPNVHLPIKEVSW